MHRADGAVIFGIPIDVAIIGIRGVRRIVQAIEGDAVDGWLGVAGVVKLGGLKPIAVVGAMAGLHVAQASKGIPPQMAIRPFLLSDEFGVAISAKGGWRDTCLLS